MKPKLLLGLALILCGGLVGCSAGKTDERIESFKLPSGEILENHTYYDNGGWPSGARINELYPENPEPL